jgi:hypothetical protein
MDTSQGIATQRAADAESVRWGKAALRVSALLLLLCVASSARAQSCSFTGSGGAIALPPLDPSLAVPQSGFAGLKLKCTPAGFTPTWTFNSANGGALPRMKHAAQGAFIAYSVSVAFINNTGANQNWRVTATVLGQDYIDAPAGSYADTLSASILP